MSASPADNEPPVVTPDVLKPFVGTGVFVWFVSLSFCSSSSHLIRSVYIPDERLSSGWWAFHCGMVIMCGICLMADIGFDLWFMWHNVRHAWRELAHGKNGRGWSRHVDADENEAIDVLVGNNNGPGGENETLLADEKGEGDLDDEDCAQSSSSPAQEHEQREDKREGAVKKPRLFLKRGILLYTLTLAFAAVSLWVDVAPLEKEQTAENNYVTPWIWVKLFEVVFIGLGYLAMMSLVAVAVYVRRRQARGQIS